MSGGLGCWHGNVCMWDGYESLGARRQIWWAKRIPKYASVLTLREYDSVILHGKRDFVHIIQAVGMGVILDYLTGLNGA